MLDATCKVEHDMMIKDCDHRVTMTTRSASIAAEDSEASSVGELLQDAREKHHKRIYLNYKGLTEIPPALVEDEEAFAHLQHVYLKRNLLKTLPTNIGNLKGLVELYLHSNSLTSLPDEICNLTSLQSLDISNNQLKILPASIGQISSLEKLFVLDNLLTTLPPELGNLQNLCILEASCNKLVGLPAEISSCGKLRSLNLINNQLRWLPRQLTSLLHLQELTVSGNRLMYLPMDLGLWQENLRTVYVDNNPLLLALPFSLWMKKIGATRCGLEEPSPELSRSVHIVRASGLSAILPPELRLIHDGCQPPVRQVSPLLELCLAAVHQLKDNLDLSTLPRSLSDLAGTPVAHCMAPSCCGRPIFTTAWVHLLKLDWAQPWQRTRESIGFVGLCCSKECLRIFKKIPVPTF